MIESPDDKQVLVTGASGFVGGHIVRLCVQRQRKVRVLLRKTSNSDALTGLPVQIVYGDVLDPASLRAAMEGCGTVFHSVVDPRFWLTDQTPIFRNNVEGLVNSMNAALECGIERFIFISTMGTLGLNPTGPVTEDIPFNWLDKASPYIQSRLEAEHRFLAYCHDKGLPGVALCVANTYGPHDYQPTPHNGMLWQIASGKAKIAVDVSQPTVDIRDVAEAALSAEMRGRCAERYIIANEFVRNRDFYAMAVSHTQGAIPRFLSYNLAYRIAAVTEHLSKLARRRDYVISKDAIYLSNVFREMSHAKAARELDWSPRPISETVHDAINWFASRTASLVKA